MHVSNAPIRLQDVVNNDDGLWVYSGGTDAPPDVLIELDCTDELSKEVVVNAQDLVDALRQLGYKVE